MGLTKDKIFEGVKQGIVWSAILGVICAVSSFILQYFNVDFRNFIKVNLPSQPDDLIVFFLLGGLIASSCGVKM